jgi:hypothetical protein
MNLKREPSSYRDPDGYITYDGGNVYRHVLNDHAPVLLPAYQKFFDTAVKKGLLVPFEKSGQNLKLFKLPVITYPYEWGFQQLKEAALLTLDIALLALEHGLSLKDATAFNVQQYKGRMIFIDHTSFESSDNKLPWRAYSQFCRHFLGPLLVTSKTGRNANKSFLANLEGLGLDETSAALPFKSRFKPSTFIHVYLHNFLINSMKDTNREQQIKNARTGNQKVFLQALRETTQKIRAPKYDTEWGDYYNKTNYENQSFHAKEDILKTILSQKKYSCIWDVGANNGHFSRIMATHADIILSMDIDYAAIDHNYLENRREKITNVFPMVMDLTNPSPALGFGNKERTTIDERSKPDLIFALALIHHLAITYNIPFASMAAHFRAYNTDLVVEYVDREDSQFKKLLRNKQDTYDHYNRADFESSFLELFEKVGQHEIPDTARILYHFRPK